MTTIVYDHKNKQIAVDSRCTACSGIILSDNYDKFRHQGDETWFLCGNVSDIPDIMELKHRDEYESIIEADAFMVKDGKCYLVSPYNKKCSHTELEYDHALGSGYQFALSGLHFTGCAKKAVEFAITKDSNSGGEVKLFDIKSNSFIKQE